jgi:hypothetical protein
MKIAAASWPLYLAGSLLVFGSWVEIVPTGLGWIGWLMALVGWAAGSRQSRTGDGHAPLSNVEQIEKLDQLRQRTVISEDEFQREKRRLLEQPDAGAPQHAGRS